MDIVTVGRWVLLAIGAVTLLGAVWFKLRNPEKNPFWMWVFGLLIAGIGAFGPEFMPKYGDWLAKVADMIRSPGVESYMKFFDSVGNEEIPVELRELGVNYAISHPIDGMENILEKAINRTPENTDGKKALEWAYESFQDKKRAIDQLLMTGPSVDRAKQFDQETGALIYYRLKQLPQDQIQQFGIKPTLIPQYKPMPKRFPGKKPGK